MQIKRQNKRNMLAICRTKALQAYVNLLELCADMYTNDIYGE